MAENNNPFKYTCTLKQHTPIIHFQHDQKGATLRASEMKPKLDRFIYDNFQKFSPRDDTANLLPCFNPVSKATSKYKLIIKQNEKPTKWLITSSALDENKKGKLRNVLNDSNLKFLTKSPYFAQENVIKDLLKPGIESAVNHYGLMSDMLSVEAFSFSKEILSIIKKALPYFFVCHNFGTRQGKGFGCFTLADTTHNEFKKMLLAHYQEVAYYTIKWKEKDKLSTIFQKIGDEYKIIKSGKPGDKNDLGLLFSYFNEFITDDIISEKTKIDENIIKNHRTGNEENYSDDENIKYTRSLLGLAELHDYPQLNKKVNIEYRDDATPTIKRMQSPLLFKVFENTIYMLPTEVPKEIYGKKFRFSDGHNSVLMRTPAEKFLVSDFIKYCVRKRQWQSLTNI